MGKNSHFWLNFEIFYHHSLRVDTLKVEFIKKKNQKIDCLGHKKKGIEKNDIIAYIKISRAAVNICHTVQRTAMTVNAKTVALIFHMCHNLKLQSHSNSTSKCL